MKSLLQFARDVADSIAIWCLNPKCPFCLERTTQIEAHVHTHHAGDDRARM